MALFEFNADFIASVSYGRDDEDVLELFAESIRAGADVLEDRLLRSVGPEAVRQAQFVDGAFEIPLDQDQFDVEYGGAGEPPQPKVRRAIISASIPASQAMARIFSAD